jgi:tetratricopeptide (TPR) repeat protein
LLEDVAAKLSQLSANHDVEVVSRAHARPTRKSPTLADAQKEFGVNLGLAFRSSRPWRSFPRAYSLIDATDRQESRRRLQITAPVSDLFTIEDKLTSGVADALQISLRGEERQALGAHSTTMPEAYQYFVQGVGYLRQRSSPKRLTSAETVFKQALKVDPNYGPAEAGLGETYWYSISYKAEALDRSRAASLHRKPSTLGNAGAEGHMCSGNMLENGTGEYEKAAEQFQQAVQLDPVNDRRLHQPRQGLPAPQSAR